MTGTLDGFVNLVLLFFSYSFIGWCIEVTLKYFQYHRFINRGFLTGPWLPIYGTGGTLITLSVGAIAGFEAAYGTTFAISFVICGLVEYSVSYYLEKRFHARWWDYRQKPMNLHGRVWIGNLILFGIGGLIIIYGCNPLLLRLFDTIPAITRETLASSLSAVFAADFVGTHFILKLVKTGVESSEADNTEAIRKEILLLLNDRNFFYRRFAAAYPDVIYHTEQIAQRMEEIKAETERLRLEAEEHIETARAEAEQHIEEAGDRLEEVVGQRLEEAGQRLEEAGRRLEEGKQQLAQNLELPAVTKNTIIEKQDALINLLYDEETATEEMRSLKKDIDVKKQRLNRTLKTRWRIR